MRIVATLIESQELRPGELFSTAGPEYWNKVNTRNYDLDPVVGERVYIRTDGPCPDSQRQELIYRITIQGDADATDYSERQEAGPDAAG